MKRMPRILTSIVDRALSLTMKTWTPWDSDVASETPRPADAPRGHGRGYDSDRILLFGTGPAMGWGVSSHELALPGNLARHLSQHTGRGSDVDLIAQPGMTGANAPAALDDRNWARYDAIVVMLGVNDALVLTRPRVWRARLSRLLAQLQQRASPDCVIVVMGIHPVRSIPAFAGRRGAIAERRAHLLNRETRALCATTERTVFAALPAQSAVHSDPDRHRTAGQYEEWAKVIAEPLVPVLTEAHRRGGDRQAKATWSTWQSELERQRAVDAMQLPPGGTDAQLQRVVMLAQKAFKVQSAQITVLDHDTQRLLAATAEDLPELPRSVSFCDVAIRGDEAMVVRDTRLDERFRENPMVVGEPHVRFYAGFPIETPSGHRIGTLCVVDTQPRLRSDDINLGFLRDLARLAERELWRSIPRSD